MTLNSKKFSVGILLPAKIGFRDPINRILAIRGIFNRSWLKLIY